MGRLATQTLYRCDNCIAEFQRDNNLIPPNYIKKFREVILSSPYDLDNEEKSEKPIYYIYEVNIELVVERHRGMQEFSHMEEVMLCPQCQEQLIKQVLVKERDG